MQNAGDEYACLWVCFVHVFLCLCVYSVCWHVCVLKMCAQVYLCVCVCVVCAEVSVKVCLSVMMERQGSCHLTQCYEDTEPYVSAQSWQLRPSHPWSTLPHLQPPPPTGVPPTVWLSCLIDSSCCPMKQRHKCKYGPGSLLESLHCYLCWWSAGNSA